MILYYYGVKDQKGQYALGYGYSLGDAVDGPQLTQYILRYCRKRKMRLIAIAEVMDGAGQSALIPLYPERPTAESINCMMSIVERSVRDRGNPPPCTPEAMDAIFMTED